MGFIDRATENVEQALLLQTGSRKTLKQLWSYRSGHRTCSKTSALQTNMPNTIEQHCCLLCFVQCACPTIMNNNQLFIAFFIKKCNTVKTTNKCFIMNAYAHIEVVVTFLVVNFFGFLVITRHHEDLLV